jgi:hypothetical protein
MVGDWLKNGSITNVESLIQIVGAYCESSLHDLLTDEFYSDMQLCVLKSAGTLNYRQAIDLAAIMFPFASTELMEVFDRLIGA